jgi:ABC-type antimicrobial peptide transport system permease subunit
MFKNYFKTALRNLLKNRLSSFINLTGLALAVGCSLVVFLFIDWSMNLDSFHSKIERIFVVEKISEENGEQHFWGDSPAPMGPLLKQNFSAVKNIARFKSSGVVFKQGENIFYESISFVDNSFHQMFDFPIKWGSTQIIGQNDIILTHRLSEKLFGKQNPLGKSLTVIFDIKGQKVMEDFNVKAVLEKMPLESESSFYFSSLISFDKMSALGLIDPANWNQSVNITFVEADRDADLQSVSKRKEYLNLFNKANQNNKISSFHFQALKSMNLHAYKVKNVSFNASKPAGMITLFVIGIAILLLVYFNYMNIAIASASARLKEIGVRKVLGSNRSQIISQFILEHLILCTLSIMLGVLLAEFLFLPWFGQIANLELSLKLFTNYRTSLALVSLIIISALSGAAYPAFYISSFKTLSIIKQTIKLGNNNKFRKMLLGFQFFLTILAIATAIAFNQETKDLREKPWGYNPVNTLVVKLNRPASYEVLKAELQKRQDIASISGAVQALGYFSKQILIKSKGKEQHVQNLTVLPGFASQMGINILKGRDLNNNLATDISSSIIVNQAFLKQMKLTSGLGEIIEYENRKYTIVGETNDFHFESFNAPVGPMVIMACEPTDVGFAYIKTDSESLLAIEKLWKRINPNIPFEYYYQDKVFDGFFNDLAGVSRVLSASSLIMVLISMAGIFGLASLILSRKMKDISVRKVMGAGMFEIGLLVNKEFLFAVLFGSFAGLPLSYWIINSLFNQISPESHITFHPLFYSFIALILITSISVAWHVFKAHTSNPIKYLREE